MTEHERKESQPSSSTQKESAPQDPLIGSVLDKRFELLSLLGTGSTGSAYKARNVLLDKYVVVKILHKFLLASPEALERFRKEAQIATALNHHGISQVFSHGMAEDGRPYIVMDYLQGESLANVLQTDGCLSIERFFNLFLQVTDALNFAHEKGVIHRDIKPSNIVIVKEDNDERAIILDFGIAKTINESGDQSSTKTGALLGSSAYMSPEQCRGAPVDNRSDIYSLGCIMVESLLGKTPFQSDSQLDMMYKHLNESAEDHCNLTQLPAEIAEILRKCLKKNASDRYQSLIELKDALRRGAERQDTIKRHFQRKPHRRNIDWRIIAGFLALASCSAGVFLLSKLHLSQTSKDNSTNQERSTNLLIPATLPKSRNGIEKLLTTYRAQGKVESVRQILSRWEQLYMSSPVVSPDAKIWVLANIIGELEEKREVEKEAAYIEQIEKLDSRSPYARLLVARLKANLLRFKMHPDQAIIKIENALANTPIDQNSSIIQDAICDCLRVQADSYYDTGNVQKAAECLVRAVDIRENYFGKFDPEVNPYRLMAIVALAKLGRRQQADEMLRSCLAAADERQCKRLVYRKQLSNRELDYLLNVSGNLARPREGGADSNQSSLSSPAALEVFSTLANIYIQRKDENSYLRYRRMVIEGYKKSGRLREALTLLDNTACTAHGFNDYQGAAELWTELLKDSQQLGFAKRISVLTSLANLNIQRFNRPDKGCEHLRQAYALLEQRLKAEPELFRHQQEIVFYHLLCTTENSNLMTPAELGKKIDSFIDMCGAQDSLNRRQFNVAKADHLVRLNKVNEALILCQKQIEFFKRRNPPDREAISDWKIKEAEIFTKEKKYKEALDSFQTALSSLDLLSSAPVNERRRDLLSRIAETLIALGRDTEASNYYTRMEELIGPEDLYKSLTISTLDLNGLLRFGLFVANHGNYAKAESIYKRIKFDLASIYGEDSKESIMVLYYQANLLRMQKKIPESIQLYNKVIALSRKYGCENLPLCKNAIKEKSDL